MRRLIEPYPAANVVWLDTIDSTNALADRLMNVWAEVAEDERLADTVLIASTQSAGRGRGANRWESPPGGVYVTWLGWIPAARLQLVPMASGAALAAAIDAAVPGLGVGLRWPNDLLVGGRKLGGILCRASVRGEDAWAMVGFGVNAEIEPGLPARDRNRPAALAGLGWKGDAEEAARVLVAGFLAEFARALAAPNAAVESWRRRSVHMTGEVLRVRVGDAEVEGKFVGLGEDGRLMLNVGGEIRHFAAGELLAGSGAGG
ncbi:MAG: biotin--[acetyl-CoA-carboxylase] ligase [Acidobacteriota bacterium]